jgi:hypothetical protein
MWAWNQSSQQGLFVFIANNGVLCVPLETGVASQFSSRSSGTDGENLHQWRLTMQF